MLSHLNVQNRFGRQLGKALWHQLVDDDKEHVSREELEQHAHTLLHVGADWYIQHFMPADRLLRVFFEVNGVEEQDDDRDFVESLLNQMVRGLS